MKINLENPVRTNSVTTKKGMATTFIDILTCLHYSNNERELRENMKPYMDSIHFYTKFSNMDMMMYQRPSYDFHNPYDACILSVKF